MELILGAAMFLGLGALFLFVIALPIALNLRDECGKPAHPRFTTKRVKRGRQRGVLMMYLTGSRIKKPRFFQGMGYYWEIQRDLTAREYDQAEREGLWGKLMAPEASAKAEHPSIWDFSQ